MRRGSERFGKTHLSTYENGPDGFYETWQVVDNKTGTSLRISAPSATVATWLSDLSLAQDFRFWYETYWRESKDERPKKKPRRYKKK